MAFRFSNHCLAILNVLTFLLSIPILISGVSVGRSACEGFLNKPLIAIGIFLLLVSIAGFFGSCFRVSWLLWAYLISMLILIVLGVCFTIFAFTVTSKGSGISIPGKAYKEYRLGEYSNWMQHWVSKSKRWKKIRSCLVETKVCSIYQKAYLGYSADRFFQKNLPAIMSGCCKPPNACNFTFISASNWNQTNGGGSGDGGNGDCKTWDNDPKKVCLDCQSCKAGVVDKLQRVWKKAAIINIVALILLIFVSLIAICAFKNNLTDQQAQP